MPVLNCTAVEKCCRLIKIIALKTIVCPEICTFESVILQFDKIT